MHINELDDLDKKIIDLLQKDPSLPHSEIAQIVSKTQPTISARILKMIRQGFVENIFGLNFASCNLPLFQVEIQTNDNDRIFKRCEECPFIVNAINKSGEFNITLFVTASDMEKYNRIVDSCLRRDKTIIKMISSYTMKADKNLVFPFNLKALTYEKINCSNSCQFKEKKIQIIKSEKFQAFGENIDKHPELKLEFDNLLISLKEMTRSDAIGIRFINKDGEIPFYTFFGLTKDFLHSENQICLKDGFCGFICRGEQHQNCTDYGSIIINNYTTLFDALPEDLKAISRTDCAEAGYKSVALIPLRTNELTFGMIFLSSYDSDAYSDDIVANLENSANLIANALSELI
jgi:Lrp/AsnC family transcriptional regulator